MHSIRLSALILAAVSAAVTAKGDVIDLTFEGINPAYPSYTAAQIQDFYNGGVSSAGTSGPDYGISFPDTALAICLNTMGTYCSAASRGGLGDPNSQQTGLFFETGTDIDLNDPAGFANGFSLNYSAVNEGGAVSVWSGLNGTGTQLASVPLAVTSSACVAEYEGVYCPFVAGGAGFAGTAQSIDFSGVADQIVFDDVTFGSSDPGPQAAVPEPGRATLVAGFLGMFATLEVSWQKNKAPNRRTPLHRI